MALIVSHAVITRSPNEVLSHVTDPSRSSEWQSGVVAVNHGRESHVTTQLDFRGQGIGKMLLPVVVRQARGEGPEGSV